jgi:hypothetical protein
MASVWKRSNSKFLTACFRDYTGRQLRISNEKNRLEEGAKSDRYGFKGGILYTYSEPSFSPVINTDRSCAMLNRACNAKLASAKIANKG